MGRKYSGVGDQLSAADDTIISLQSAATIRPELFEFLIGSAAVPGDLAFHLHWERWTTAAGTKTDFVAIALDPDDPPALAVVSFNHTAEPTYTADAQLYSLPLNQRATYRWVASPGSAFKCPATATTGIGFQFQAVGGAVEFEASILFEE